MLIQYNMLIAVCDLELVALTDYGHCFKIQTPRYTSLGGERASLLAVSGTRNCTSLNKISVSCKYVV